MTNDLISRSALVETFRTIARAQANARVFVAADAWESAACKLETAPAVDAVEVVRCRDCSEYIPWLDGEKICGLVGSYHGNTKPDDYCSRGRKRE